MQSSQRHSHGRASSGPPGVVAGGLRRARPKGTLEAAGTREAWETAVQLPTSACRRPAGICGLDERRPGRTRTVRPHGPPASGSRAPSSSRARSTPSPWGAPRWIGPVTPLGGAGSDRRLGRWPPARPSQAERRPDHAGTAGAPPLPDDLRAMLEAVRRVGRPAARRRRRARLAARARAQGLRRRGGGRRLRGPAARPRALRADRRRRAQLRRHQGARRRAGPSTTSASRGGSRRPGRATAASPSRPTRRLGDAEAAARRDFTVNAIAYDPVHGRADRPLRGPGGPGRADPAPHEPGLLGGSPAGPARLPARGALRLHARPGDGGALPRRSAPASPSFRSSGSGASGTSGPSSR